MKYSTVTQMNVIPLNEYPSNIIDTFDLKFENFPNIKSFKLWDMGKTKMLASNIFTSLKKIEEIQFPYCNFRYLEERSLLFSSNEKVKLGLFRNLITIKELSRSGLWNE